MTDWKMFYRVEPTPNPIYTEHVMLYWDWCREMIGERGASTTYQTDVCEDCFAEMDGTSEFFDHKNIWISKVTPFDPSAPKHYETDKFGVYEPEIHKMQDVDCDLYIWEDVSEINPLETDPQCRCEICGHVNPEEEPDGDHIDHRNIW